MPTRLPNASTRRCVGRQSKPQRPRATKFGCRISAPGGQPCESTKERRSFDDDAPPPADLQPHIEALQWAKGLIFIYPTRWYSKPAILKGWIDRIWRPGITFTVPTPTQPMRPALTHVRRIGVIAKLGSPWWF